MAQYPGFIFGSDPSQSPLADPSRTVNWYPEPIQAPGVPSSAVLYPTPGWRTYVDTGAIGCRAMYAINGTCYAVVASGLYTINTDRSATLLNSGQTMAVNDNPAQMIWDGHTDHKLAVTSGGKLYLYDTAPTTAPWTLSTTPRSTSGRTTRRTVCSLTWSNVASSRTLTVARSATALRTSCSSTAMAPRLLSVTPAVSRPIPAVFGTRPYDCVPGREPNGERRFPFER